MRIVFFKLKNFSTVMAGMQRREIVIDLTKSTNRVVLLVGRNGTGKTSLLSQFHPFAMPGSMDVRNGPELIMEGKDGYKEIHYQRNGDLIVIKHHYLYASNKGTKSYISVNGEERNPNGNVSSFIDHVERELGMTQDLMKIMRLGPNVGSFIKSKAAERKSFTSNLLSEIDIYTKLYKKINDDNRMLRSLIKSVIDKIGKLKVYDEADEVAQLETFEAQLKTMRETRNSIQSEVGSIDGSIKVLAPDGLESFASDIRTKDAEHRRKVKDIELIVDKLSRMNLVILGSVDDSIKKLAQVIADNNNQETVNRNMMEFYFKQLNSLYDQKQEKEDSLKYVSSATEYTRLTELFLELHRKKESMDKRFKDFQPKVTKDEMLLALSTLQEMDKVANDIHEFDTKAVEEVLTHVLNGNNVDSIAKREVVKIDDKISRLNGTLTHMADANKANTNNTYVLFKPPGCGDCPCPFQQFYEDVVGVKNDDSSRKKVQDEVSSLERRREFFMSFSDISRKVDLIMMLIKSNNKLIEKMPENFFDPKHVLESIKGYTPFYDEDYITNYVTTLEDYEEYLKIDEQIKEVQREKTFIEKNGDSLESKQKELSSIDNEIYKIEKELQKLKDDNKALSESTEAKENQLDLFTIYQGLNEDLDKLRVSTTTSDKELDVMRETFERIKELLNQKQTISHRLSDTDRQITLIENEINNIRFRLREFSSLNEERESLEEKFEDVNVLREALSSNKGIPLLYIQLYLKNTRILINRLLSIVYEDDIELEEFIINEKEFRIPYRKHGLLVSDIAAVSQGEESFLSLAFSFALIEQEISESRDVNIEAYTVMLLDEIDAALDEDKREKFLPILEEQLDTIEAEQVFIISHNNAFDNYPVDIIKTSEYRIDNYKNTTVIFQP
jgi:DNA repair exonuclease SbcCD ATPase subunit